MEYKSHLYKKYGSTHNSQNSSELTLEGIKNNFPVFDYYYSGIIPVSKEISILDIGCGIGSFVYFLQEKGYREVVGIDLSEEQIQIGADIGIKGLYLEELNQYLGKYENRFDCIIARDVIEHLTRQEAFEALNNVFKALKPGGKFIMQVPNGEGINYTSIFYGDYTHEMAYTWRSINQLFLNIGFQEIYSLPVNPYSRGLKGKMRAYLWALKVMSRKFWKMIEFGSPKGVFTANIIAYAIKPIIKND